MQNPDIMSPSLRLVLCLLVVGSLPPVIRADSFAFGGPGFTWFQASGLATPNHIWVAGDYWDQSFTPSLSQENEFDFHLVYNDNSLAQTLNMEVLVNGSFLGDFSISPRQSSSDLSFGAMFTGPTFDVRLEALNTIPSGQNSVSLDASGLSTAAITIIPEPCSTVLLGAGLAGLAGTIRGRFRK
jgi:hypothetical protein